MSLSPPSLLSILKMGSSISTNAMSGFSTMDTIAFICPKNEYYFYPLWRYVASFPSLATYYLHPTWINDRCYTFRKQGHILSLPKVSIDFVPTKANYCDTYIWRSVASLLPETICWFFTPTANNCSDHFRRQAMIFLVSATSDTVAALSSKDKYWICHQRD